MSDEFGATGDFANQRANCSTFHEAVTLQFIAEAWEIQVTDQVEDGRSRMVATGRLAQIATSSAKELLVGSSEPISQVDCRVWFTERTKESEDDETGSPVGEKLNRVELFKPIGDLLCVHDGLQIRAALKSANLREMRQRHFEGLEMPRTIVFWLPGISGTPQPDRRGLSSLLIDANHVLHEIASASWTYGKENAANRWNRIESRIALEKVNKLIDSMSWKYDGWKLGYVQFNQVAAELLTSALYRLFIGEERRCETEDCLGSAWEIAIRLWDDLSGAEKREHRKATNANPQTDDTKSTTIPWRKRHPDHDFELGLDSNSWSSIEADDILDTIDRYLSSQFESPTFEWICADILAYAEIRTFGEETKKNAPVSLRNFLGIDGRSYYSSAGNLRRMRLNSLKEERGWTAAKLAFWVGIPIAIGARYWYLGRLEEVTQVAISWVILVAVWVVLRGLTGSRRRPTQLAPEVKSFVELRRKMGTAYRQITSDNSPSTVLKSLQSASAEGAVWPGRISSLLEKACQRDPICWRNLAGRDGYSVDLAGMIDSRLRAAFKERKEAGVEMDVPEHLPSDQYKR